MAEGYSMDNALGFCTEYMTRFKPSLSIWNPTEH